MRPLRPSIDPGSAPPDPWAQVARLATRQGGMILRDQLREVGLRRSGVRHAVDSRRLLPQGAELFMVGHASPTVDAELHRALLLSGAGGVLSHRTAAWIWGIGPHPARLEVTVPTNRRARRRVSLHRARLDLRHDVKYKRGLPVTSLALTIVQCAAVCSEPELARIVNEAAIKGWLHRRNVALILELAHRRDGAPALRRALDARDRSKGWTRSSLEAAFAALAREAALPRYERGIYVDIGEGDLRECDVVWLDAKVMVELDFLPIHETGQVPYRDRRRDRRLAAAGWTVIRLTGEDLTQHRAEVVADLRRALDPRRHDPSAAV